MTRRAAERSDPAADDLNEILNDAVPRWAELTGTKLGTSKFTVTIGSNSEFQDLDLKKYIEALNDSRTLDTTGTTAILLLRGLFEAYVAEKSFKLHALLYAPDQGREDARTAPSLPRADHASHRVRTPSTRSARRFEPRPFTTATISASSRSCLEDDRTLGELRLAASRSLTSWRSTSSRRARAIRSPSSTTGRSSSSRASTPSSTRCAARWSRGSRSR